MFFIIHVSNGRFKVSVSALFEMLLSPLMNKVLEEVFDMELALWLLAFKYKLSLHFPPPVAVYSFTGGECFLPSLSAVEPVLEIIWVRPGEVIAFSTDVTSFFRWRLGRAEDSC